MSDYIARRNQEALTASDLIEKLKELDPMTPIWADGCDCRNPVVGIDPPTGSGPTDHATLEVST